MSNIHGFSSLQDRSRQPLVDRQQQSSNSIIRFGRFNSDGSVQNMTCFQAFFPDFKKNSFTFFISIIQFAVFIITQAYAFFLNNDSFGCINYKLGAKFTPAITVFHHFHRLIFPIILHGGFMHIFFNMLGQWFYSYRLESVYGTKKFAFLYLIAGIGGNLLSAASRTGNISVGASSSLFGVFALYMAYLIEDPDRLGPRRHISIIFMVLLLLSNIGNATQASNIDNSAHLGILFLMMS